LGANQPTLALRHVNTLNEAKDLQKHAPCETMHYELLGVYSQADDGILAEGCNKQHKNQHSIFETLKMD
jgi:hypothetical protein